MLTITVPCSNDLTTSVTLCLWSHKHLGILQQWWSSGSKAAAAMTVAVTSTGTLGGNKALSMLSRLYWPCLLLLAEIAWKNSHAVQERLLTRNPKSSAWIIVWALISAVHTSLCTMAPLPRASERSTTPSTTSTHKVSVPLRNVLLPQMSCVLTRVLWRTHPMVNKKPTKKLLAYLAYSPSKPTPPVWKAAIYTLPLACGIWETWIYSSTACTAYNNPLHIITRSPQKHSPSSVAESLCYCTSLSLVKHCQSHATKSHHVFVPLFPFAYLNKPTLTTISVSASTDVMIHCNWVVPGVQQIDTAPFLAEFWHCFPLLC